MTAPTGPFFRRGVTRFVACPSVLNPAAPTRAEIDAGTVLTNIVGIGGFQVARSFIDTPDLDSDFTGNVAGERKAGDSSLTFKDVRGDTTNRDVLAEGNDLVMIYMPYGDVPGERCETWPVTSSGVNDQIDLSTYAQFMVGFSVPEPPEQNAIIPA
jgi:hypothetical protein